MAYNNWGAKVWRNGKPYPERCDVPVFRDPIVGYDKPGVQKFWGEILRLKEEGKILKEEGELEDFRLHPHHCVLGEGPVRLAGYKDWGVLYTVDDPAPVVTNLGWGDGFEERQRDEFVYEYKGQKYKIFVEGQDNRVLLRFEEPNGTIWHAVSGYQLGEGFENWTNETVEEGWR